MTDLAMGQKRICPGEVPPTKKRNTSDQNVCQEIPSQNNPLLNPVILSSLFQLCQPSDLRRFRQVCKLWHDISLNRWRNSVKIFLVNADKPHDPAETNSSTIRKRLKLETLHVLYDTPAIAQKPYTAYFMNSWKFTNSMLEYLDWDFDSQKEVTEEEKPLLQMGLFWRNCGIWMSYLELSAAQIYCATAFNKVIFELTPNLQTVKLCFMLTGPTSSEEDHQKYTVPNMNLKKIKLSLQDASARVPFSWRQIFKCFPNLEELDLTGNYSEYLFTTLINCLEELEKSNELKIKIKTLDIRRLHHCSSPNLIERLLELPQLKLESLYFDPSYDTNFSLLPKAFHLHKNTLKIVRLFGKMRRQDLGESRIIYPSFPFKVTLPQLTTLSLGGINTIGNLDFLEYTPNLKYVHINGKMLERIINPQNLKILETLRFPQLEELRFDSQYYHNFKFSPGDIEAFSECMPNVKRFRAPLTAEAFRTVCQVWKELWELEVVCHELEDKDLTGIVQGSNLRLPNLADLKYLYSCTFSSRLLTELSIIDGFFQLPSLYNLSVTMSEDTNDEAYAALCKKIPARTVLRWCSDNQEKQEVNCKLYARAQAWAKDYGWI